MPKMTIAVPTSEKRLASSLQAKGQEGIENDPREWTVSRACKSFAIACPERPGKHIYQCRTRIHLLRSARTQNRAIVCDAHGGYSGQNDRAVRPEALPRRSAKPPAKPRGERRALGQSSRSRSGPSTATRWCRGPPHTQECGCSQMSLQPQAGNPCATKMGKQMH